MDTSALTILLERLSRILQQEGHAAGLKPTQWEVLRYLVRANRFSRHPSAVAAYLGMTKGTVSQTIATLEKKGLVKKTPDRLDQRNVHLALSKAGKTILADDPLSLLDRALSDLPANQQAVLTKGLEAALKAMLTARAQKPFGLCQKCIHFAKNHEDGRPHFCALLATPLTQDDSEKICAEQASA